MADEKDEGVPEVGAQAVPAKALAPNWADGKIVVAGDHELERKSHFRRLGIATAALNVSRRELPNLFTDTIYGCRRPIVWGSGAPFCLADEAIDDAFNNDESFRWLSDFMRFVEVEPKQRPQRRVLARLRIIDLYFRIAHPERAKWIAM